MRTSNTSCHLLSPDYSICKKEDNENSELHSQKPCGQINLSQQNDYESVKLKLLQLKHTFDKAMCNNETVRQPPLIAHVRSDEEIKLPQEDKSEAKTGDPFDLSSEDDLHPEKYRPLKRKLCTDINSCGQNNNASSEPAEGKGAADIDSPAVAAEAVSLKTSEIKKPKTKYRVAYVHSKQLLEKANELIRIKGRAELVHSLISSVGLLQYLQVVSPRCATETDILGFHCPDYVAFLRDSGDVPDGKDSHDSDAESYGLSYDCPLQKGIFETCSLISGATIVAAETLINNAADVAINWYGGWHHAKRDSAAGFCYINDIVLGILKLREKFDRILYVDIDLHHGDGVEEAFCMTPKVMTVSFHKYMFGFFPGTGSVRDIGTGKGKYYSVNVPLLDGIRDAEFCAVFYSIMKLVREKFQPQVIVLQCGADTLSSDPNTSFNLTHLGISRCAGLMLSWNLPTMLLGGGGYNFPNTAKCWSFLTSLAAGKKLPLDIPEHEHLLAYGPDFEMSTTAGNRKDCNTKQYLADLVAKISRKPVLVLILCSDE
ncbi:unnamed protein product [Candidula unifasciata]|uniref:Histone deacetylase 8 n=1 Tax=Candidula unifasciata TaxID=100452 RepID=A0A8S3ZP18_9EUPU|nr:unnamed protein product [Candidula unifasciata]